MYGEGIESAARRTFQRRVQHWHLQHGPDEEVFFTQERLAGLDFLGPWWLSSVPSAKRIERQANMAFLYQIQADGSPIQHWAFKEEPLVVGRGEHADAHVEDDTLSSSHFLIIRQRVEHFAIDLKSSNGTWINGNRILAHKLQPGEVIQAGQSLFCFTDCPPSTFAGLKAATSIATSTAQSIQPP
jgi:hypothetical protein